MASVTLRAALDRPGIAASVPVAYRGLWRRTLLRTAAGRIDRDTRVFWMQTARLHIDIRVPIARPACAHAGPVGDLTRDELIALSEQQGFAGITVVENDAGTSTEHCTWHRQIDYSPPSDARDTGTMRFETPDIVLEDGIDVAYHERWEREPSSMGINWSMSLSLQQARAAGLLAKDTATPDATAHASPAVFMARCGNHFMLARARSPLAQAALVAHRGRSLREVMRDPDLALDDARALLDFEISLGQVRRDDGARWLVNLSTLPYREGCTAFDADVGATLDAIGQTSSDLVCDLTEGDGLTAEAPAFTYARER